MFEIDTSLQKRFRVTEHLALNFRAVAYNLFHQPVYSNPSGSIGTLAESSPVNAGIGRITAIINEGAVGTGASRRIEFTFRAEF